MVETLLQFGVKNAFLHGEIEEEIYMEIPPSYGDNLAAHTMCKLKKALHGLKQSPRPWFGRFARVMMAMGYNKAKGIIRCSSNIHLQGKSQLSWFMLMT